MISAAALTIIDEVLSNELANFTDYLADPRMEGQEGLAVAQAEVDRLQPVLDEVRAAIAAGRPGVSEPRHLWKVIPTSWVAWISEGELTVTRDPIGVHYLELLPGCRYVGCWDHHPTSEEVAEAVRVVTQADHG